LRDVGLIAILGLVAWGWNANFIGCILAY